MSQNQAPKLSVIGYYGCGNTGDEAILSCLIDGLREFHIAERITVFSSTPELTAAQHRVDAVRAVLPTSIWEFLVRIVGRSRKQFFLALRTFLSTDMLIVGGGGLFYDNPESNHDLLALLQKIRWARLLGKNVCLLGVGAGPVYHASSRAALKKSLNKVNLIAVRDPESQNLFSDMGIDARNLYSTADFVFLLKPAADARIAEILAQESIQSRGRPRIGISLCSYQADNTQLKQAIIEFCHFAVNELNAHLCFIPMQTEKGFDDRKVASAIVQQLPESYHCTLISGEYTPQESLGIIGHFDAMLAERLHGAILAINARVPVLGLSYMPKVERLFSQIGHPEWQIPLTNLDPQLLQNKFLSLWNNRTQVKDELGAVSLQLQEKAKSTFNLCKNTINNA